MCAGRGVLLAAGAQVRLAGTSSCSNALTARGTCAAPGRRRHTSACLGAAQGTAFSRGAEGKPAATAALGYQ